MRTTYSGPPNGQGAAWAWKSKSEGDGKMTFNFDAGLANLKVIAQTK